MFGFCDGKRNEPRTQKNVREVDINLSRGFQN
jgi:hypothetical protein